MAFVAEILAALKDPSGQHVREATELVINKARENPRELFEAFFQAAIANPQDRSLCLNLLHQQFVSLSKENWDALVAVLPVIEAGYRAILPLLGECDQNAQQTVALIALGLLRMTKGEWPGFKELMESLKEKPEFWGVLVSIFYYFVPREIEAMHELIQQIVLVVLQQSDNFQARLIACDFVNNNKGLFQAQMEQICVALLDCVRAAISLGPREESSIWQTLVVLPVQFAKPFLDVACERRKQAGDIDVQASLYEFIGHKLELNPQLLDDMFVWYKRIQLCYLEQEGEMDQTLTLPISLASRKALSVNTKVYAQQFFGVLRQSVSSQPPNKLEASFAIGTLAMSFLLLAPYLADDDGPLFVQTFGLAVEMQVPATLLHAARLLEEVMESRFGDRLCERVPLETFMGVIVRALACGEQEVTIRCLMIWRSISASSTVSPTAVFYSVRNQHEAFKNAHMEHIYFSFLASTFCRVCEIPEQEVRDLKQYLVRVLDARQIPPHWPAELFLRLVDYFPEMFTSDEITRAFAIIISAAQSEGSSDGMVYTLSELISSHLMAPSQEGYVELRPLYPMLLQLLGSEGILCVPWSIIGKILKQDSVYFSQNPEQCEVIRKRWATRPKDLDRDRDLQEILWLSCVWTPIRHYLFGVFKKEVVESWIRKLLTITEKISTENAVKCLWWLVKPQQVERYLATDPSPRDQEMLKSVVETVYERLKKITEDVAILHETVIVPYMKILSIYVPDKFCEIWTRLVSFKEEFSENWEIMCNFIIRHCFKYNCENIISQLMSQFVDVFVYMYDKASSYGAQCACYESFLSCCVRSSADMVRLYERFIGEFAKQQDCVTLNLLILQIASGRPDVFEYVAPQLPVIAKTLADQSQDGHRPPVLAIIAILNFLRVYQGRCPELDAAAFRLFTRYLMLSPSDMVLTLIENGGEEWIKPMTAWVVSVYDQFGSALERDYAQQPLRLARLRQNIEQNR